MEKQRWEASEKRQEEERRSEKRKSPKKEDAREWKSNRVAKHCVFPMICGSGRSQSRLAKAAGAEPFGRMRDEKLHMAVVRSTLWSTNAKNTSTFSKSNVESTPVSEHFWKLRCWKSVRCCGAKHISKSNVLKTAGLGPRLDVQMSLRVACARDSAPCQMWAKREGFVAVSKALAGGGRLKRICKDAFRVAGAVQETCSSEMLGGQGADFLRGVVFWSVRSSIRFAKMILRDRCSTSYDLASFFCGRRCTLDRWNGKIAKRIGTRPLALHSTKSRRIASFWMLPTSNTEDASQNSFVFDVVKFNLCGSPAELLRLRCCQVQNLRKSCRPAAFWMLSSSRIEDVSQNSFAFKLADRQIDRQKDG